MRATFHYPVRQRAHPGKELADHWGTASSA
jgi:hypothetical protein